MCSWMPCTSIIGHRDSVFVLMLRKKDVSTDFKEATCAREGTYMPRKVRIPGQINAVLMYRCDNEI